MKLKLKLAVLAAAAIFTAFGLSACNLLPKEEEPESSETVSEVVRLDLFPEGTVVGGIAISGKTLKEGIELCEMGLEKKLAALSVSVKFEDETVEVSGKELKATSIVEELLTKLFAERTVGSYELEYMVDEGAILKQLDPVAQKHTQQAQNSTVEYFDAESESFSFTEPVDGKKVDLSKTAEKVAELFNSGKGGKLKADMTTQPAAITADMLAKRFTKLSSFSTVSTNTENGTYNMKLSLERINGTVLESGEEFSFNRIVGDSTYDGSGFLPANGLMGGVLVPMYGGGICQSSSTIYGAALRAGMEITLRDCHSSPSTYVPIGLDATVSYDDIDFRFSNPYDTPVYIVSYVSDATVYVAIYGCQPEEWDSIEVNSWQSGEEPIPAGVRYLDDSSLESGEYYLKSEGNIGYYAQAERVYYKNGEQVRYEELSSSYYGPMQKTYMVGPGTDTSKIKGSSGNTST